MFKSSIAKSARKFRFVLSFINVRIYTVTKVDYSNDLTLNERKV